ncbi:hypothetical protein V2E24_00285 [Mycoplasmopsis ciconiae]|uniref:Lipoprotein n=1 Tax=Mycoplasmopsis ciconiae TaxID=561067 RepID=A0ABU7MKG2_9BACT|nr:hypothetical protein [Mycoplasmopsis ciconiae]
MKLKNKKIAFSLLVTSSALVIPLIAASCNSTQANPKNPVTEPSLPSTPNTNNASVTQTPNIGSTYLIDANDEQMLNQMPFSYFISEPNYFKSVILKPILAKEANKQFREKDFNISISADQFKNIQVTKNADNTASYTIDVTFMPANLSNKKFEPKNSKYTFSNIHYSQLSGINHELKATRNSTFNTNTLFNKIITLDINLKNNSFLGYLSNKDNYNKIIKDIESHLNLKNAKVVNAAVDFTKFRKTAADTFVLDFWVVGVNESAHSNGAKAIKLEVAFKVSNEFNIIQDASKATEQTYQIAQLYNYPAIGLASDTKLENYRIQDLLISDPQLRKRYLHIFEKNLGLVDLGYEIHYAGAADINNSHELVPGMSVARLWLAKGSGSVPGISSSTKAIYILVPTVKVVANNVFANTKLEFSQTISQQDTLGSFLANPTTQKQVLQEVKNTLVQANKNLENATLFVDEETFTSFEEVPSTEANTKTYKAKIKLLTDFGQTSIANNQVKILEDSRALVTLEVLLKQAHTPFKNNPNTPNLATFDESKLTNLFVYNVDLSQASTMTNNLSSQTLPIYYADANLRSKIIESLLTSLKGKNITVVSAAKDFDNFHRISNDAFVLDFWIVPINNHQLTNQAKAQKVNVLVKVQNETPNDKIVANDLAANYNAALIQNQFVSFNDTNAPLIISDFSGYYQNSDNRLNLIKTLKNKLNISEDSEVDIVNAQDLSVDSNASKVLIEPFENNPGVAIAQFWIVSKKESKLFTNAQKTPVQLQALVWFKKQ